jgi:AcrR family transcriptional regulator
VAPPRTHDEALRITLLDRAGRLLSDKGPDALILRRLAADAGTSTTAVYSLFGNKAGLMNELYREAVRRFAHRLATVEPTDDPATDVIRIGIVYRDYALAEPHLYAIMFDRRKAELELDQDSSDEANETFEPLVDAVVRGQAAGQFRPVRPQQVALSCWGIAHGLVQLELNGKVPPGVDIAAEYQEVLRAIVDGWRCP